MERLPVIAVPTTSGTGSHVTQAAVVTDAARKDKATVFHSLLFPRESLVDPELMTSLPAGMTSSTGFDAFSHAMESYLNKNASPYSEMLSLNAMELIAKTLPKVLREPQNIRWREKMALADTWAGTALANTGADIPHPLSEIISGVCPRVPHGCALAMVYSGYVKSCWQRDTAKFAAVARILGPSAETGVPDDDMAARLPSLMEHFLQTIRLSQRLGNYGPSVEELSEIENSPVLDYLPMAPKETLLAILRTGF